jgi:DNA mismatch repair ATPase MutS
VLDRFGIHCAHLANLPTALLEQASAKAKELEDKTNVRLVQRREARAIQAVKTLFSQTEWSAEQVEKLRIAANVFGISS